MTILVVSVCGSNTSPFDTWAKSASTLQAWLTARAAFEDVWWEKDSTDSYSTSQT